MKIYAMSDIHGCLQELKYSSLILKYQREVDEAEMEFADGAVGSIG